MDQFDAVLGNGFAARLDIDGFNYKVGRYPEAELFLNGKSLGRRKKSAGACGARSGGEGGENAARVMERFRLMWNDVSYEPCELRVVAYDSEGKAAAEKTVRTVDIKVEGPGRFIAVANGDPTSLESFQEPSMHLFNGQLTVIVTRGTEVKVSAKGLRPATFRE